MTHDEETIAVLLRIRQAVEHLAEQQTYAYLAAPNFISTMQTMHYRGVVRITRATGAVALLEQGEDGSLAWHSLPMEDAKHGTHD